jgi:hypothetical protein
VTTKTSEPKHILTRRSLLIGAGASLLCAPAIVRAGNIMPVRKLIVPAPRLHAGFVDRLFYDALDRNLKSGRMTTVRNGRLVTEAEALRWVAHARGHGWLKG